MSQHLIREIEQSYLKTNLPELNPGDTVKVMVRIKEGNKERLQGFEGVIIKIQGQGTSKSVTVRRVFQGIGVERAFLIHSPRFESILVLRRGIVRRARLYYLRALKGKSARIKERLVSKTSTKTAGKSGAKTPATV
ncbi:MAG: 50S ribosomal protein L19 [Vampirovibrionales bacterium]|nr:50S ribosomal protein L19 [Vampirovibrionales bacterium]